MDNQQLQDAARARKDEFYTTLEDIEAELKYYKKHFKGRTVLCNCDDPYESFFFKYFALNFNRLGLKKLICTSYAGSPVIGAQLDIFSLLGMDSPEQRKKHAIKIEITEVDDFNGDGSVDIADVEYLLRSDKNVLTKLNGDGSYDSEECIKTLEEADIVVTNPPFSQWRGFVKTLYDHNKLFLILGNLNAITYKEIFPLIKDGKIWLGASIHSGDRKFYVPDGYPLEATGCGIDEKTGRKYIRVKGVRWWTNIDYPERHEPMDLYKKYDPAVYPQYDNYNGINVDVTAEIPRDYAGYMGVPISALDKMSTDQFEIVKFRKGDDDKDLRINGKCPYFRIIVKNKHPEV